MSAEPPAVAVAADRLGRAAGCFGVCLLILLAGCRSVMPGSLDVLPQGSAPAGAYRDICPRFSHSGQSIAFLRSTPNRELQLFIASANLRRLAPQLEPELVQPDRRYGADARWGRSGDTLAWSPDDHRLAFERIEWFTFRNGDRLPGTGLWSLDVRTGAILPLALHPTRYTSGFYFYHNPRWSPDGKYLAFVGEGLYGNTALAVRPLLGQSAQDVTPRFDNYEASDWPSWRPDMPHRLAFVQGFPRGLQVANEETVRDCEPGSASQGSSGMLVDLRGVRASENGPSRALDPRISSPVWSPDGDWMAMAVTPDASRPKTYAIWIVGPDGTRRRISPADGHGYLAPVWIQHGTLGALRMAGSGFDVVTLTLSGAVRLVGHIPTSDCDWSPDRSEIVYASPVASLTTTAPTTLRILHTGLTRRYTAWTEATLRARPGAKARRRLPLANARPRMDAAAE